MYINLYNYLNHLKMHKNTQMIQKNTMFHKVTQKKVYNDNHIMEIHLNK